MNSAIQHRTSLPRDASVDGLLSLFELQKKLVHLERSLKLSPRACFIHELINDWYKCSATQKIQVLCSWLLIIISSLTEWCVLLYQLRNTNSTSTTPWFYSYLRCAGHYLTLLILCFFLLEIFPYLMVDIINPLVILVAIRPFYLTLYILPLPLGIA